MNWREVDMFEAVNYMQGKTLADDQSGIPLPPNCYQPSSVMFTDGTIVAASSNWSGPYSEVTPDIDDRPPVFWIGEP